MVKYEGCPTTIDYIIHLDLDDQLISLCKFKASIIETKIKDNRLAKVCPLTSKLLLKK